MACDIQAPSADDSVALILWYKDDSLAPIYTVDARKGESHSARGRRQMAPNRRPAEQTNRRDEAQLPWGLNLH